MLVIVNVFFRSLVRFEVVFAVRNIPAVFDFRVVPDTIQSCCCQHIEARPKQRYDKRRCKLADYDFRAVRANGWVVSGEETEMHYYIVFETLFKRMLRDRLIIHFIVLDGVLARLRALARSTSLVTYRK